MVKFYLQIDIHIATKRQCSNCIKQGHIESSWSEVVGHGELSKKGVYLSRSNIL